MTPTLFARPGSLQGSPPQTPEQQSYAVAAIREAFRNWASCCIHAGGRCSASAVVDACRTHGSDFMGSAGQDWYVGGQIGACHWITDRALPKPSIPSGADAAGQAPLDDNSEQSSVWISPRKLCPDTTPRVRYGLSADPHAAQDGQWPRSGLIARGCSDEGPLDLCPGRLSKAL